MDSVESAGGGIVVLEGEYVAPDGGMHGFRRVFEGEVGFREKQRFSRAVHQGARLRELCGQTNLPERHGKLSAQLSGSGWTLRSASREAAEVPDGTVKALLARVEAGNLERTLKARYVGLGVLVLMATPILAIVLG